MTTIQSIVAAQRFDSRGFPTVQVVVKTERGEFKALVPSGASKGDYEAIELRDGGPAFSGKGVLKAVSNVNDVIGEALIRSGVSVTEQEEVDEFLRSLDGTDNKSKLGANAILGCSMAIARAGAAARGIPLYEHLSSVFWGKSKETYVLPVPCFNVINGGAHSGNRLAFQEFMLVPSGATSFAEAMRIGSECYHSLKKKIASKYGTEATGIGDEGGFAPPVSRPEEALELLTDAVADAGYTRKVSFAIDPASQEFMLENGNYDLDKKSTGRMHEILSPVQLQSRYHQLISSYPIVLLEDPFGQDDWETWTSFARDCQIELVGDDLLATNIERLKIAIDKSACNSMLLKVNQIGTVSEALAAARESYAKGWSVFVSHRSGETTDDFIADLTVAIQCGHLKSGAPCRGERLAKYNRLLDIEDQLGNQARFAGPSFRKAFEK